MIDIKMCVDQKVVSKKCVVTKNTLKSWGKFCLCYPEFMKNVIKLQNMAQYPEIAVLWYPARISSDSLYNASK